MTPCQPGRCWAWCREPSKRRGSVPDLASGNAAIGQSGGPTAVINQSLVGVVEGLKTGLVASGKVKSILGMRHGVRGIVKAGEEGLVDLTSIAPDLLERVARTP